MRQYNPFKELIDMQREMDRRFNNFWSGEMTPLLEGPNSPHELALPNELSSDVIRTPLADMKETEKEIITHIEMPGVDKKDIKLNVTEDGLEVRVEQKHEKKEEKEGMIRMESGYRSFYRHLPFPAKVMPDKAEAKYEKGILEIRVEKETHREPKKLIEIK